LGEALFEFEPPKMVKLVEVVLVFVWAGIVTLKGGAYCTMYARRHRGIDIARTIGAVGGQ